ncbi:hypothetical protein GQ600_7934 [Phytophthora cactorum]|nr:hypothetical protein GQ600_7934 [Phytophthora cactorum]
MATTGRTHPATSAEAILQFVLDALHHLTGLPLLMVNQPDHNPQQQTQGPFSEWSDDEAPEEEMSDLSSDEEEIEKQDNKMNAADAAPSSTAQNQLFDGLQFYLAVSQVRERTVRSVLELGWPNYDDFTGTQTERVHRSDRAAISRLHVPAYKKPSRFWSGATAPGLARGATASVGSSRSTEEIAHEGLIRAHLAVDEEGRVRRPSLPSHGHNISRVA